ncbi:MAG: helix-turn-helix domain-containing protein [bacterium]|jgi:excisionase family DNA binding protein|nr:helix-turn-helix domain-containing protein [bacterium]
MEQLYTLKETADLLKVSIRTITRIIEKKNLPVIRIGNQIRIKESVVEQLGNPIEPISIEAFKIII